MDRFECEASSAVKWRVSGGVSGASVVYTPDRRATIGHHSNAARLRRRLGPPLNVTADTLAPATGMQGPEIERHDGKKTAD